MDFDAMGKSELRAACKDAGIGYGKLTVSDMRAALVKLARKTQKDEPAQAPTMPAAAEPVVTTPPKPEKQPKVPRVEQNGVKCPKAGGLCAQVWEYLDANPGTTSKQLREVAPTRGWNLANCQTEMYAWRRFHGISGRTTAPAS